MSAEAHEPLPPQMSPQHAVEVVAKTIVGLEAHIPTMYKGDHQQIFTANGMVEVARDKENAQRLGRDLYPVVNSLTARARAYEAAHGLEAGTLVGPEVKAAMGVLAVEAGWTEVAPRLGRQISVGWEGKHGAVVTRITPATPAARAPQAGTPLTLVPTPEPVPMRAAAA